MHKELKNIGAKMKVQDLYGKPSEQRKKKKEDSQSDVNEDEKDE